MPDRSVLGSYYPLTLLTLGMSGVLAKQLLEMPAVSLPVRRLQVALLLSLATLMGGSWVVSLADNVIEFAER